MTTNNFKPILFSTEMVQAILAGRKTQTRRVIKDLDGINLSDLVPGDRDFLKTKGFFQLLLKTDFEKAITLKPKYKIGDILWVRETYIDVGEKADQYFGGVRFHYKANQDFVGCWPWKPSIFMPKEAARIFLKVTNVRVERLQDISHNDALLEGIIGRIGGAPPYDYSFQAPKTPNLFQTPQQAYRFLWQSINAKKHPWESNPWVWVYEFERIEKPENFLS